MKRKISFIFVLISIIFLIPITAYARSTKTVTDMDGKKVQIPQKVTRVADLWHANNQVILLLGGQKKIVATTPLIKKQHWFVVVDPAIKKVLSPFAGDQIQVEELLKTKPDVVIAAQPGQLKAARQAKLPTVNAMYNNFSGLKKSVNLTAQVLGGNAPQVAKKYNRLLDHNISYVQQRLAETHRRPTVVHFVNSNDLTKVDGRKTIVDQWIKIAGGKNAISQPGNQITVNNEELLKKDPDVIIVGSCSTKQARAALKNNSQLKDLTAVRKNKVYGNPQGTFPWDRYSAEEALQVLWAAKLLHPAAMRGTNLSDQTKQFYSTYYHYHLSNTQVKQILNGEN